MSPEVDISKQTMYAQMMDFAAWKDLESFMAHEIEESMKRMDVISAENLSVGRVCEERGYRKGLRKIFEQSAYMRERG